MYLFIRLADKAFGPECLNGLYREEGDCLFE